MVNKLIIDKFRTNSTFKLNFSLFNNSNFFFVLFANGFSAICQFAIVSIISKHESTTVLGYYALAQSITVPAFMLSGLQLRPLLATDAKNIFSFPVVLLIRSLTSLITLIFLTLAALHTWGIGIKTTIIILFSFRKFFESFSEVYYGYFQKSENMFGFSLSLFLKSFIGTLAFILAIVLFSDIYLALIGLSFGQLVIILGYDRKTAYKPNGDSSLSTKLSFFDIFNSIKHKDQILILFRLGIPLGVVMMILSFQTQIPKYFLEHFVDTTAVGVLSAIAYFHFVGEMFMNSLGQTLSPKLSRHYVEGNKKQLFRDWYKLILAACLLGGVGLATVILSGEKILLLFFNSEISSYSRLFPIIMLASFFAYLGSCFGYLATAMRKISWQPVASILSCLFLVVLCVFLVPRYGISGASYAILFGAILSTFLKSIVILTPSFDR